MKINEIFSDTETLIYKVINFYDTENMEEWEVEKTSYKLIPESNELLYDALFIVKAYLPENAKVEHCYIDLHIPERISEFVFRLKNGYFVIENAIENNLGVVPAMASEQYGDPELYFLKSNPQIGIDILEEGKTISANPSAMIDDLAYIYEELELIKSAKQEK